MKFKVFSPPHTRFAAIHLVDQLNKIYPGSASLAYAINIADKSIYIIYCAASVKYFPVYYIVLQTEIKGSHWFNDRYFRIISRALAVWDYSESNIISYKNLNKNISILTPGIDPKPKVKKDIPVLFYGFMNKRRRNILCKINSPVMIIENVMEWKMWELLNRAKVVVNIHFYDYSPLELFRINEALSHNCHVVSEGFSEKYSGYIQFVKSASQMNARILDCLNTEFTFDISGLDNTTELQSALQGLKYSE